jgi:hypothetical protein
MHWPEGSTTGEIETDLSRAVVARSLMSFRTYSMFKPLNIQI